MLSWRSSLVFKCKVATIKHMSWKHHTILGVIVALLTLSIVLLMQDSTQISGGTWFQVQSKTVAGVNQTLRLENNGIYFLRPGQKFNLLIGTRESSIRLPFVDVRFPDHWMVEGGTVTATDKRSFKCVAPKEMGNFELIINYSLSGVDAQDRLLLAVMKPSRDVFASYPRTYSYPDPRTSTAPKRVRSKAASYAPPQYMFAVKPELLEREVVPAYSLGSFICPSSPGASTLIPYAAIDSVLIEKLRAITLELIKQGIISRKVLILEGYRSPRYNASLSGAQPYSRHIYGDAITFMIDEDGDGTMDDLNNDGVSDRKDGAVVARIIRALESTKKIPLGGMGINEYVSDGVVKRLELQIDCRGYSSVWGVSLGGAKQERFSWWK